MARKKGDGRGRLGGRAPGVPNKDNTIKTYLRQHSTDYFTPSIEELDDSGKPTGRLISQFDLDILSLEPQSRVDAETKLLKYHTPQMQATSVDVTVSDQNKTLTERLAALVAGEEIKNQDDT